MSIVTLLSGGLDSCLMSLLIKETNRVQKLLFINYGQLNYKNEFHSAKNHAKIFGLPTITKIDLSGFSRVITSGLTDARLDIVKDGFLPGRNLLFILTAAAFAIKEKCNVVSMGLLHQDTAIFPDQTDEFILSAEHTIEKALGEKIKILTPLREFCKSDVVKMAKSKNIKTYYSCHKGDDTPCGKCISCKEFES